MYFLYNTNNRQEINAIFNWLVRRKYIERGSVVVASGTYDYVCIDIQSREFGFFAGKFVNPQNVSYMTPKNFSHLLNEVQLAESNKLISFVFSTNTVPWVMYPNIVPPVTLEYKFL